MYFKFSISFIIILFLLSFTFSKKQQADTSPIELLGKQLFSDKTLSLDSSISCTSCHNPKFAFADTVAFSKGITGVNMPRNTPSVLNMKERLYFFWDGRATSLEEQAIQPLQHKDEMGIALKEVERRVNKNKNYVIAFKKIFNQTPNIKNITKAIAAFQNSLETVDSKYDAWADDEIAFTESEERGRKLFVGSKAKCFDCHFTPDFTGDLFKNIGLYNGKDLNDVGRYAITKNKKDLGKFKTPGLRNIAVTAPYMHNGKFSTLDEVLNYYNNTSFVVYNSINKDTILAKPLNLSAQEQKDIIAFLHTLTDKQFLNKK